MTIMRVSLAGVVLSAEQKERLAQRLVDTFSLVEVGHAAPEARAGFLVRFEDVPTADLRMGHRPMAEAGGSGKAAVLEAHVMAGPWNDEMKADLFAGLEQALREVAEMPRSGAGSDVWITFVEVPEGAWGLGGRTVSIAQLAPVFAADRQQRIRDHLGASSRLPSSGST